MTDDSTPSQVLSAEYTARVLARNVSFLGVCVFGPRFNYNTFLVDNRRIG